MPPATCPCCGAETERPLIVDLMTNRVVVGDKWVQLAPQPAEILYVLAEAYPGPVSIDRLLSRLHGAGDHPEFADKSLHTRIHHLRKQIAPLGLRIITNLTRGYALELNEAAPVVHRRGAPRQFLLNGAPA